MCCAVGCLIGWRAPGGPRLAGRARPGPFRSATARGWGATEGGSGVLHEGPGLVQYAQPLASAAPPSCSTGWPGAGVGRNLEPVLIHGLQAPAQEPQGGGPAGSCRGHLSRAEAPLTEPGTAPRRWPSSVRPVAGRRCRALPGRPGRAPPPGTGPRSTACGGRPGAHRSVGTAPQPGDADPQAPCWTPGCTVPPSPSRPRLRVEPSAPDLESGEGPLL